jgi:hypothetical protein
MSESGFDSRPRLKVGDLANAHLLAGELWGLAMRLDADLLEKFLRNPPADFRYASICQAAINFRRELDRALRPRAPIKIASRKNRRRST